MTDTIQEALMEASRNEDHINVFLRVIDANDNTQCKLFYKNALVGKLDSARGEVVLYITDSSSAKGRRRKHVEKIARICRLE